MVGWPADLDHIEQDYRLYLLSLDLADHSKTLTDYGLPEPAWDWAQMHNNWAVNDSHQRDTVIAAQMQSQLNTDQLSCFNRITTAIATDPQTAHFYLQGPGGTGKTFLYKTICYHLRSQGKTILCVASTGIAALLLPNGRTSHSQFKIPIELNEDSCSSITKQSRLGRSLQQVDLIIWDEVPIQHKYCFEVVHRLMVDLRSVSDDLLFGGVPVILGGDFAQILPVVMHSSRADIMTACLQRSFIWPRLQRLHLRTNIRVQQHPRSRDFIRWIRQLPYSDPQSNIVTIPDYIRKVYNLTDLISTIYPTELLNTALTDWTIFRTRCLLSTLNTTVTELNKAILTAFPGPLQTYGSVDSQVLDEEATDNTPEMPVEVLQNIELSDLPPSQLQLKRDIPIILLRNLYPEIGICNGSRMVVEHLQPHVLHIRLLGGDFDGQERTVPRIKLLSSDDALGIKLARKQFPVRLCFAMTINKSQGQSFEVVGLDLRTPVFTHGQFYIGVSRTSSVDGLTVLLPEGYGSKTINITYPEVLTDLN
jgi:hypothetical protein